MSKLWGSQKNQPIKQVGSPIALNGQFGSEKLAKLLHSSSKIEHASTNTNC
jgi:hypothetical protein